LLTRAQALGLLIEDKFEEAVKAMRRDTTTGNPDDRRNSYILSLLYRLSDRYADEKELVYQVLRTGDKSIYWHERKKWHDLPVFDKMESRSPVWLEREPKYVPRDEILEKMCFVTGGDTQFFGLMVECIESLRATEHYGNIPVCIIDGGFSTEQINYLYDKLKVREVKDPGWDVEVPEGSRTGLKCKTARPFMDRHFPGFTYYFWIDADVWIQDGNVIDMFISFCDRNDLGVAREPKELGYESLFHDCFLGHGFCRKTMISADLWDLEVFKRLPIINSGLFCIKRDSLIFDKFKMNMLRNASRNRRISDQVALTISLYGQSLNIISYEPAFKHNPCFFFFDRAKPAVDSRGILYTPDSDQIIGALHLLSCLPYEQRWEYYRNTFAVSRENGNDYLVSYRYRVWPWRNKASLKGLLLNEFS